MHVRRQVAARRWASETRSNSRRPRSRLRETARSCRSGCRRDRRARCSRAAARCDCRRIGSRSSIWNNSGSSPSGRVLENCDLFLIACIDDAGIGAVFRRKRFADVDDAVAQLHLSRSLKFGSPSCTTARWPARAAWGRDYPLLPALHRGHPPRWVWGCREPRSCRRAHPCSNAGTAATRSRSNRCDCWAATGRAHGSHPAPRSRRRLPGNLRCTILRIAGGPLPKRLPQLIPGRTTQPTNADRPGRQ